MARHHLLPPLCLPSHPRTVLHFLVALRSPAALKFHSLDHLQVRIIVFQRSMAGSLTPIQTRSECSKNSSWCDTITVHGCG